MQRIACYRIITGGFVRSFVKFCVQNICFFSEINPYPQVFLNLKSFLWKGPLTVKVRKKIIYQILGYIIFRIEILAHLGHLFA